MIIGAPLAVSAEASLRQEQHRIGRFTGTNLTTGSNNIDIGSVGVAGEANTIRVGTVGTQTNTFIAGIHGVTVASAVGVVIDVNGHSRHRHFVGPVQGNNQTDGQGERSDSCAQAGHIPL